MLGLERGTPKGRAPGEGGSSAALPPSCWSPRAPGVSGTGTWRTGNPRPARPRGPQLFQAVLRPEGLRWCPLRFLPEEFAPTAPCPRQELSRRGQKFRVPGAKVHPRPRGVRLMLEKRTQKARGGGAGAGSPSRDVLVTSHSKRVFYSFTFSQPPQYTSLPL